MVKKTTSLKIEDVLWKKVKIHAIESNKDISEYIEDLICRDLKIKNNFGGSK